MPDEASSGLPVDGCFAICADGRPCGLPPVPYAVAPELQRYLEKRHREHDGSRCQTLVDGITCGYFNEWDELYISPDENEARRRRHKQHLTTDQKLRAMVEEAARAITLH